MVQVEVSHSAFNLTPFQQEAYGEMLQYCSEEDEKASDDDQIPIQF